MGIVLSIGGVFFDCDEKIRDVVLGVFGNEFVLTFFNYNDLIEFFFQFEFCHLE